MPTPTTPAGTGSLSFCDQMKALMQKNWAIQKRKPGLTAAEYFLVVCYLLFYYKLMYVIFPDDRMTPAEVDELQVELDKGIPNSCAYVYMDAVAFIVPAGAAGFSAAQLRDAVYHGCGLVNVSKPSVLFESASAFEKEYTANPMTWYAGIESDGSEDAAKFTILHNETLDAGRYMPNLEEDTGKLLDPNFLFLPVLNARGVSLNFGDNRLADLQARVQHALVHMDTIVNDATHVSAFPPFLLTTASFPFEKPSCEGAGCVIMYTMPQLITWVFMVTLQALFTALGREKERSIKESLLLSGMSQWAYFASWMCSKLIDAIPPCIVWVGGAYALGCIEHQYFLPVLGVTYLYAVQILAFSLAAQTFFKTQQSMFMGSIMVLLVLSLCYYPIRLLGIDKAGADLDALSVTFVLPAVPICHYYWELAEAEGMGVQLDYSDKLVSRSIWTQPVSALFWLLVFAYFEQIMPQAHGPAHQSDPCFCCKLGKSRSYKSTSISQNPENNDTDIEMVAKAAETKGDGDAAVGSEGVFLGIDVRDLVMEFDLAKRPEEDSVAVNGEDESSDSNSEKKKKKKKKKKKRRKKKGEGGSAAKPKTFRAVDDLNCKFPQGQICAVLGHNGAGKTTSIRCITGSLAPTSGSVIVNGRNILRSAEDMNWMKRNVGVCPQHDVLYDELTAREHVVLFGAMRGIITSSHDVENGMKEENEIVNHALAGVDMLGKADELVRSFSGGQKRRLSVALALLGEPSVVILDEPTTGMDVITRQSVWKSIQKIKKRATVILTTHAMEEADALGDRVIVLSRGKVQAQGTSLDLKKRFGVGFHLHVVTKQRNVALKDASGESKPDIEEVDTKQETNDNSNDFDASIVVDTLKSHISETNQSEIKVLTNVGAECSVTLPSETASFPALFSELEERRDELGIEQLALSMTTLEEVFLQLGKMEEEQQKKEKLEREKLEYESDSEDEVSEKATETKDDKNDEKPKQQEDVTSGTKKSYTELDATVNWAQQIKGVAQLNMYSKSREPMTSCAICIQPILFVCIAGIVHLTNRHELKTTPVVPYVEPGGDYLEPPSKLAWANDPVEGANYSATSYFAEALQTELPDKPPIDFTYASRKLLDSDIKAGNIGQPGDNYVEFAVSMENTNLPNRTMSLLVSDHRIVGVRQMVAAMANALITSAFDYDNTKTELKDNAAVKPTYRQLAKGDTALIQVSAWGSGGIMILCAFPIAFMSAFYGERLIRDRTGGMRVHLFVSSLKRVQYYIGNFGVDFLVYCPVAVLTPILLLCFQFEGILMTNLWAYVFLFIFFAPSLVAFGYLVSWMFNDLQTAQEWFGEIINFSMSIPWLITAFVILDASELGHTLCGLVPGYAIYRGFAVIEGEAKGGRPYDTWSDIFDPERSLVWVYVILIIDGFFYWGCIWVIEKLESRCGSCRDRIRIKFSPNKEQIALGGGGQNLSVEVVVSGKEVVGRSPDANVLAEKAKYEDLAQKGDTKEFFLGGRTGLQIAGICKTFVMNDGRLNEAVKNVCLGVEKGSIFGLLGMNGAGKTTLLHTIQGKHQATNGDCYIDGQTEQGAQPVPLSCCTDVDRVRQLFGICPQHEVIWEFVTPREHLRAFANIRGVDPNEIEPMVKSLLTRLNLMDKADEPAGKLSGGMKRRLSIAMAVIGNPRVVFLDEPTTGLDPNTRRFVWDYILEIKKNRIVVLTTHSMEEADALCTRIGIMVNGELKSLGTPQELKRMYGGGYRVIIRLNEKLVSDDIQSQETILKLLQEEYDGEDYESVPKSNSEESSVTFVATNSSMTLKTYNVQREGISFGKLFELIESKSEELGIMDYSVSQTTMDEVFRKFAKFQVEDE